MFVPDCWPYLQEMTNSQIEGADFFIALQKPRIGFSFLSFNLALKLFLMACRTLEQSVEFHMSSSFFASLWNKFRSAP